MKILITGANGFIGSHVAKALSREHELCLVDLSCGEEMENSERLAVDLRSEAEFKKLDSRIDAIIHLAQGVDYRDFPNSAINVFDVNAFSTLKLLEYGRRVGAKKFLYASTGTVYTGRKTIFSEDDAVLPPYDFYALSKFVGESLVQRYSCFMTSVILRFITVYGPGQKERLIPKLIEKVSRGENIQVYGGEGLTMNPIYIDDAVEAVRRAVGIRNSTVINVGGTETLTILHMGKTIGKVLGIKPFFEFLPEKDERNIVGTIDRMEKLLHLRPQVSFVEGVRRVVEMAR